MSAIGARTRLWCAALGFACVMPATAQEPARQEPTPQDVVAQGNHAYHDGKFQAAQRLYGAARRALPDSPVIQFNWGDATFKQGDYGNARRAFQAALNSDDPHLISRARYNLGNVQYRMALFAQQSFGNIIAPLRNAVDHYRAAIALDPDFEDARYNLELAHRFMRALEKQNVQPQSDPRARRDVMPENQGVELENERESEATPTEQQAKPGTIRAQLERLQQLAQMSDAPPRAGAPAAENPPPLPPMSIEEANELLDSSRSRAGARREQREQARRARLRDAKVDRIW